MAVLKNRAKMSTSTTGTGTITLGSAESGYQTFADAGVANADVVRYVIEDGNNWEIGTGTYTATGTTLSRTVSESSNSDAAINLSGSATVFIGATAEDILSNVVEDTTPQLGGNLDVQTREITTSTTNGNVKLTPNGTGVVEVKGAGGNDGTLQLNCSANSHGVKIKSPPHSAAASYTLTLPDDDGAASEFLQTDGSGNLSWAAGSSIGGNTGVDFNDNVKARFGTGNDLQIYHTGAGSIIEDTGFGPLHFKGSTSIDFFGSNGEYMAYMVENGAVGLYHDGSQKLNTTSSGIQTTGTVNVNNAYTLPTADGTANQVLTTNGSGAVTFADAAGGDPDLYRDNAVNATTPTAAGDNAFAIGSGAISAGNNSAALGNSRAGAASSIAGAINNNSSSYGTTGVNTVSFGTQSKATNNSAVSIGQSSIGSGYQSAAYGYNAVASGQDSFAGGPTTDATATNSTALGKNAQATHANATAVGYNAATSTTNQVALGASGYAVRVSGAYTLPTSDGTNGQVLTTDGAGAVTFAAAGGGGGASAQTIDIKTADYTVVSGDLGKIIKYFGAGVDRTVTLTAGATLGEGFHVTILNANSGADERVVIDANSTETFGWSNGPQTITLSRGELVRIIWDNTGGRWIIGEGGFNLSMRSDINPATTTAAGDGANGAIALGLSSLATGSQAISLGKSLASNSYAFAASIANNTSSYGATGTNSIAMGYQAKARDTRAVSIGYNTDVNGYGGVAIGDNCYVNQGYGVAMGNYARTHARYGAFIYANGYLVDAGDAQTGIMVLRKATTDATPSAITSTGGAASSANQLVLTNESAITFTGTVVCREDATDGDDYAGWEIKGVIMRQGQASDTTLGVGIVNNLYHTAGLANASVALSADTSNGALKVEATGIAATNLHWVATLNFSEVKNF